MARDARKPIRAALVQTVNAFAGMPDRVEDLRTLAGRLDEVREANLEHNVRLVEKAARLGARLVGLGELFAAPYFALSREAMWRALAEDAETGPCFKRLSAVSKALGLVIVGPIYEKAGAKRYNAALVIDRGRLVGRYRKTHIPRGSNEQGSFDETFYYGRGARFPVFRTSVGRLGVAICYDRHFEGVVRALAKAGAQVILSPAVTFGEKSRRMWELEFLVDAARHRVCIGGSNRLGSEKPWNQPYFGSSYFAGPDGRKLEDLSDDPNLVIADLDLGALRRPDPSGWDLARDARGRY